MATAVLLCIVTLVLIWAKSIFDKRRSYALSMKLEGPRALPIIGNMLEFAVPQKKLLHRFDEVYKKFNSPVRFWLGPNLYVFIDKPEHIQAVLTSSITTHKGDMYHLIADCIGYGLIQSSGAKHRLHRKHLIMPLRQKILDNYVHIFDQKAAECARCMDKYVDKGLVDVIEEIENCCMALICEMLMGYEMKNNDAKNHELIFHMNKSISERIYKVWLHPKFFFRFSKHYRLQNEGINNIHEYLKNAIDKRKEELKHVKYDINMNDQDRILDLLILAENSEGNKIFSDVEIMEEMISLFSASEDTTLTVASFATLMMAMHQDVQEKVWLEQVSVLGSDGDPTIRILPQHLEKMTYLHMVIQEVLRLFPIATSITRKLKEDFPLGDNIIPKDLNILINVYRTHRDEATWTEPDKFNPMRFTPEAIAKRHPYAFLPFSHGVRGCIGKQFAYTTIKCVLSHIIRNYKLHSDWTMDTLVIEGDISVRSTNGYKVKISRRIR